MTNKDFSYQEALRRSHQEALVTLGAACLITIVFWLGVFAFEGSMIGWFGVPLWFWASCVGGYFFSILIVWILIRFCFKNFSFDPNYEES